MPCALDSFDCFPFTTKTQNTTMSNSTKLLATRLRCISNYKLRSECSNEEPNLRHLLGHVSIYDSVRAWTLDKENQPVSSQNNSIPQLQGLNQHPLEQDHNKDDISQPETPTMSEPTSISYSSPSYYYSSQVPSFQDFQAAMELQMATVAKVTATHLAVTFDVEEYESTSETDSDYDSYDGEEDYWNDGYGDGHDSEGSLTDVETHEADHEAWSECSSPSSVHFDFGFNNDDEEDEEEECEKKKDSTYSSTPSKASTVHF